MITDESISLTGFFESIVENAESHILLLDERLNIITLNPALYWVFLEAFDVQLRKGSNLLQLLEPLQPHVSDKWKKRCSAALKGISISETEEFQSHGQSFTWKLYYKGVKLGQAKYVSIFYRIAHQKSPTSKQDVDHELILRTFINLSPGPAWVVNTNYELIEISDKTGDFFRRWYHTEIKKHENFIDAFSQQWEDQRAKWRTRLADAFRLKRELSFLDHIREQEKDIVFETHLSPVWSGERVFALVVSMNDITHKPIDDRIQQTQMEELIKLNNELDRFVYSTSHDLRAPLLSIIGVVNLMKRESPENQYLRHIESSITKLDNFVTNIINYSRNNRIEVLPGQVDFTLLIKEANESLNYLDGMGLVNCIQQITEDAPFFSDATRLAVIVKNVLSNAYQFFDPWKKPYVLIDIRQTRECAYIRIEDNGIGMKTEIHAKIFEMFFRGSDRSTGAGLGLYIVNNAVQKLSGKIDIRSTLGVGTVVEVQIPNLIESV
jgi:signal transduction histidine kinase